MLLLFTLKEVLTEFTFGMSKDNAISIISNSNLVDKKGAFLLYIKNE